MWVISGLQATSKSCITSNCILTQAVMTFCGEWVSRLALLQTFSENAGNVVVKWRFRVWNHFGDTSPFTPSIVFFLCEIWFKHIFFWRGKQLYDAECPLPSFLTLEDHLGRRWRLWKLPPQKLCPAMSHFPPKLEKSHKKPPISGSCSWKKKPMVSRKKGSKFSYEMCNKNLLVESYLDVPGS